jgi:hypothetical protein
MVKVSQLANYEGPESTSERSIQSMQYFFAVLGYFHFRWAGQTLVMGQYWGGIRDVGSLAWFRTVLGGRQHASPEGKLFYPCQQFLGQVVESYVLALALIAIRRSIPTFSPLTDVSNNNPGDLLQTAVADVVSDLYAPPVCAQGTNFYTDTSAFLRSDNSLRALVRQCVILRYAKDAVRRGDAIAMLRLCKFQVPRFLGYGATNYAGSTCEELINIFGRLSAHDAFVVVHDRFTRESGGQYAEKDMHLEHNICTIKDGCKGNPNLNIELIARKTETAELYRQITYLCDKQFDTTYSRTAHTAPDDTRDVLQAAEALISSGIFQHEQVRAKLWTVRKNISVLGREGQKGLSSQ